MASGKGLVGAIAVLMAVRAMPCVATDRALDLYTDQPTSVTIPSDVTTLNLRGSGTGQQTGGTEYISQVNKYDSGSWYLGGNIGNYFILHGDPRPGEGRIDVWDGQLFMGGSLNGLAVVHAGAQLQGVTSAATGVSAVSVEPGGVFAPGNQLPFDPKPVSAPENAIHAVQMPQNLNALTLAPGSTLEIQANYYQNTNFTVTGDAALKGTVRVKDLSGGTRSESIHFMDVQGTVTGAFQQVVDDSPALDYTLRSNIRYDSGGPVTTEFYLDISGFSYIPFAESSNQRRLAAALDTAVAADQLSNLTATLDLLPDESLADSLDALSPAIYQNTSQIVLAETQTFARTLAQAEWSGRGTELKPVLVDASTPMLSGNVTDPLKLSQAFADNAGQTTREAVADSQAKKLNVIGAYLGQTIDVDDGTNRIGYDSHFNGVLVGLDYALSPATFTGLAFSYAQTNAQMHDNTGDLSENTYRVGPYIGCEKNSLRFDGSATVGYHEFDTSRHIAIPGLDGDADADHSAYDASAYAALSYDIKVKPFTISPLGSLQYTYLCSASDGIGEPAENRNVYGRTWKKIPQCHSVVTLAETKNWPFCAST